MNGSAVVAAVQGSEDWVVLTAPAVLALPARAIKVTACPGTGATLSVVKSNNETASTGVMGLHSLEPFIGVKEITSLGDATEVRVYF